jgi:hypothetical protein
MSSGVDSRREAESLQYPIGVQSLLALEIPRRRQGGGRELGSQHLTENEKKGLVLRADVKYLVNLFAID